MTFRGGPRLEREDLKTASDYRKTKAPKGLVSADAREAFRLVRDEGLTYEQLAARFGKSTGTVKRWISEARDELRNR